MDITDLQMTFTAGAILSAATVAVFYDHLRKHPIQPQRVNALKTTAVQRSARLFNRTFNTTLDNALHYYAPAKKLASERIFEPLIALATASLPPVQPKERETVTVQVAPPSPSAPSLPAASEPASSALPAITIDAMLWERLIASRQQIEPQAIVPTLPVARLCGMIQQPVLEELLERAEPFTGLVLSIGINDSDSSMWHSHGLVQSVGNHIAALLGEQDFACRTAYDEFVMACRLESGAQSQRHLNHISERLWDYQLRGIGAKLHSLQLGAVQVKDQSLADSIASATERMRETKRIGHSAKSVRTQLPAV